MSTFVSKTPFNLAEFLSKPGVPRKPRFSRGGKAFTRREPDADTVPETEDVQVSGGDGVSKD